MCVAVVKQLHMIGKQCVCVLVHSCFAVLGIFMYMAVVKQLHMRGKQCVCICAFMLRGARHLHVDGFRFAQGFLLSDLLRRVTPNTPNTPSSNSYSQIC
jgi:hypothetical protein